MGEMPSQEAVAKLLAEHFALRTWDDMAGNRSSLRMLYREDAETGWDINEPTHQDCYDAAADVLSLLSHREGENG